MVIQLPKRAFYTLPELVRDWNISLSELWECFISGDLTGHVRVPLICAFIIEVEEGRPSIGRKSVTTWEGYAPMTRFQCQRFYEKGQLLLREFSCERNRDRFILPDEADDLLITDKRFGVLEEERRRFEGMYGASQPTQCEGFDPSFRAIEYHGQTYHFGEMQASTLRKLYEASLTDEPWVNGKALLHEVGSESFSLMSLFKRHPVGKELITSNKRGFYRIADGLLSVLPRINDASSCGRKV